MKPVGKKSARSARGWDKHMSKKLDSLCLVASVAIIIVTAALELRDRRKTDEENSFGKR